ncbi:MAG: major capsid protein [Deltaproteobacteria bacterium]|nr:major capsid protein [Deltaproteobacteria bacterium]
MKELNKSTLEAYVNRAREVFFKRMFWTMFFPLKYTTQLTWESLAGSAGSPVMADVIEYNASSPLKSRRTVSKASGDIPKIGIKRKMDEKDWNDYNTLKALANDSNRSAVLDIVFNDVDFAYEGVLARTEFLCMQALSYGGLSLDANNNNGVITETAVDFGIPSGNKTAVDTVWSTAASATPITDIRGVVDDAEDNGHVVNNIVIDKATLNYALATTEVKDTFSTFQRLSTSRRNIVTLDDLNNMLQAMMLPQVIVVDSSVRFENGEHTLSTVKPWKTGYVSFISDMKVGKVLHGPIAEENAESVIKKSTMVKRDHVLISKWSELEPFGEFTKGQANAFPAFNDVDSIYILKTNGTTWS